MRSSASTPGKCTVSQFDKPRILDFFSFLVSFLGLSLSPGLRCLRGVSNAFWFASQHCFPVSLFSFLCKRRRGFASVRSDNVRPRRVGPWICVSVFLLSLPTLSLSLPLSSLARPIRQTATQRSVASPAFASFAAPASRCSQFSAAASRPLRQTALASSSSTASSASIHFGVFFNRMPPYAVVGTNVSPRVALYSVASSSSQTAVDCPHLHAPRALPAVARPLHPRLTAFAFRVASSCSCQRHASGPVVDASRVHFSPCIHQLSWLPSCNNSTIDLCREVECPRVLRSTSKPSSSLTCAVSSSPFPCFSCASGRSFAALSAAAGSSVLPAVCPPSSPSSLCSLSSSSSSLSLSAALSTTAQPIRVLFIGSPAVALSALEVLLEASLNGSSHASPPWLFSAAPSGRELFAGAKQHGASVAHGSESKDTGKREKKNLLGLPGGFVVSAVLCRPPSRQGRGRKTLAPCPVQAFAESLSPPLSLFVSSDLSSPSLLAALEDLCLDVAVCAAFASKLPDSLLRLPRYGTVLIHPSLLPQYRGAAPVRRALMNGETRVGVSLLRPSSRFDDGAVLHQSCLDLSGDEHAEEIEEQLFQRGTEALLTASLWAGNRKGGGPGVPQDANKATVARKIRPEDRRISFAEMSATKIHNTVRALASHGSGVWTELEICFQSASSWQDEATERPRKAETWKQAGDCSAASPRGAGAERTLKVKLLRTRLGAVVPGEHADTEASNALESEEAANCHPSQRISPAVHTALCEAPKQRDWSSIAQERNASVRKSQRSPTLPPQRQTVSRVFLDASGALRFVCGDGSVLLVEKLQRESRGPLSGAEFWNGLMGFCQKRRRSSGEKSDASECVFAGEESEYERRKDQLRSCRPKREQTFCLRWIN
ncbi:formyl transferase domain-containing protein [Toxoplasma gondii RUB]|uniref:methionyl-tRNA formyltransferase n=1 Tax=Toxoplasma gondii RUB TaxID=935652 RepID=A0A086M0Q8_TOXGO|nr:formyl transferase domain-containing protein [Toxoplasma gondii RUB]